MKLYIVRHGETDWNKERRLQGKTDIPLNEFGRKLAVETASGLADVTFDVAYTSPLIRAKETAEIIKKADTPLLEDDRIKEISFGIYEGLCCAKENWEIPDDGFENFFFHPENYIPPEGGETFISVINRVSDFLDEITTKPEHEAKTVLIVCHGVVVNAFLKIIKKRALSEFWQDKVQNNCAVNIIDVTDGELIVVEEGITYYVDKVEAW